MSTNITSNITSNFTSPPSLPPPPGAPNFRIEYVNPVDPSTATAIYFMCGIVILCVLMGIAYKEYQSRRHNDRQRTLAYLAPYLPGDGSGGLVIYEEGVDEEVGEGKKRGLPLRMSAVAEEDGGLTTNEDEREGSALGEQDDDGAKLTPKTINIQKTHQDRL